MGRSSRAAIWVLLLLVSSGCSWTNQNLLNLGLFKDEEPATCSMTDLHEYQAALGAARSAEAAPSPTPEAEASKAADAAAQKPADETVVHKFIIRNTSKAPLRIQRVISSCGGSVGRYDQSIPAGKEGVIIITLNPKGCDENDVKSAIVVTDDPTRPAVILKTRPARGS